MTRSTRRGRFFATLIPVLAGLVIAGGLTLVATAPANATPMSDPAVVSDDNIDASSLQRAEGQDDKKGDDCGADPRCTPIKWCEGKVIHGKTDGNAIVEGGHPKPDCLKPLSADIDDKDCCKAPPGGTIIVKIDNANKVMVPVQVTVLHNGKELTKNGWAKPGVTVIKLKKLPNGVYHVKVHLFECEFGHKIVKIECKVTTSPSPSRSASSSPSPSVSAPPSESSTTPGGGSGGGNPSGGLALTGTNVSSLWYGGGVMVALGVVALLASLYRRRRTQFVSE